MSLGPWQLIIIALVILVLFGRGRISEMMGDFGKGINSFKKGMNEDEAASGSGESRGEAGGEGAQAKLEPPASGPADKAATDSKDTAH